MRTTFLGIEVDGEEHVLRVPKEKSVRAENMIKNIMSKRKATVNELQQLAGFLNFLNKAIVPGRAFTRRMYAKFNKSVQEKELKKYHHVRLDAELKGDCQA